MLVHGAFNIKKNKKIKNNPTKATLITQRMHGVAVVEVFVGLGFWEGFWCLGFFCH